MTVPSAFTDPQAVASASSMPSRVSLATARRRNPQHSVPSPCVGVCKMDAAHGWCSGCFRTLEEIGLWSRATDATKLAVWAQVEQRQA